MFGNREIIDSRQGRVLAFFDAVVAIAITVMALDLAIPAFSGISAAELHTFFEHFAGYTISFVAMGMLWYIHSVFFSYYSFTGKAYEIVLHLVLMFVITLFQPTTRAIGTHEGEMSVYMIYITVFIVMNLLNLFLLIWVKRDNERHQEEQEEYEELFWEAVEASDMEHKALTRKIASKIQHLHNPDAMIKKFAERLPKEYQEMICAYESRRKESFRISVEMTIIVMIVITASVFLLIVNPLAAMIVLAGGVVLCCLIHLIASRIRKAKSSST